MILSKILFHPIHFKLLFLILCLNVLRRYINISPTSGGAASLTIFRDVLLTKGVLVVLYFPWGG